jgi:hypothetical protein
MVVGNILNVLSSLNGLMWQCVNFHDFGSAVLATRFTPGCRAPKVGFDVMKCEKVLLLPQADTLSQNGRVEDHTNLSIVHKFNQ